MAIEFRSRVARAEAPKRALGAFLPDPCPCELAALATQRQIDKCCRHRELESPLMKPSDLPSTRRLCRLTNRALAQIKELWQYAGEDELPPDSLLQAQVEALRILHIEVPLSAKRQFQLFCSEHFPGLANIIDCLAADQVWALLSMRVQFVESDRPHAQSAAVRFGGLGRRYVLVVFDDRPAGLLSHADGSGLFPEARSKLTALSWEDIRLALMLDIGSN